MLIKAETSMLRGRIDWAMVGSLVGLVFLGSVAILSAAAPLPNYSYIIERHFMALGIGIVLFLLALWFNYQIYQDQSKIIYVLMILMMLGTLAVAKIQRGHRSWVQLPFFSFQPSELARIMTILVLANFLDKRGNKMQNFSTAAGAFAIVAPVMALIILQPDFSGMLTFFPMLLGMLFCAGANIGHMAAIGGYGGLTLALPLVWTLLSLRPDWTAGSAVMAFFLQTRNFGVPFLMALAFIGIVTYVAWKLFVALRVPVAGPYFLAGALIVGGGFCSAVLVNHQLKNFQRNRFVAFLAPQSDPRGAAYNVHQAQIAIGSGGLWGKGIFSGTQSQLGFLPERHTDFIYATIGEEMGFVGAMSVLGFYLLLLWRIIQAARLSRDRYGHLVCVGILSVYGFYSFVNMGMNLGVSPVAGIQLPLVSYGGSNLAITLFNMGIVANVYSKRYAFY